MTEKRSKYNAPRGGMLFRFYHHIKPYTRMTKRGKFVKTEAIEYITSQSELATEYSNQMALNGWDIIPSGIPITISIEITRPDRLHGSDLSNQVKALEDAANGVVWKDDRYIDTITADRMIGSEWLITVYVNARPAVGI